MAEIAAVGASRADHPGPRAKKRLKISRFWQFYLFDLFHWFTVPLAPGGPSLIANRLLPGGGVEPKQNQFVTPGGN